MPDPRAQQLTVPMSVNQFGQLLDFLRNRGDEFDLASILDDAVALWLQTHTDKDTGRPLKTQRAPRGFNWPHHLGSLFLPEGTELRMKYKRYMYYAKVIGDEIIFGGKPVSPAGMVMEITKSPRNSWTDLWIHRPNDKDWIQADKLRRKARQPITFTSEELDRLTENGRGHRVQIDKLDDDEMEPSGTKRRSHVKVVLPKYPVPKNFK